MSIHPPDATESGETRACHDADRVMPGLVLSGLWGRPGKVASRRVVQVATVTAWRTTLKRHRAMVSETTPMVLAKGHKRTVALDQSALLEVLEVLKAAEVGDRIRAYAEIRAEQGD